MKAQAALDALALFAPRSLLDAGWVQRYVGADGLGCWVHPCGVRLIHSVAKELDGNLWSHISVSEGDGTAIPSWATVRDAGWLIHPDRFGVIVVAPESRHVNIAEVAHVWYCLTADVIPDFSRGGESI